MHPQQQCFSCVVLLVLNKTAVDISQLHSNLQSRTQDFGGDLTGEVQSDILYSYMVNLHPTVPPSALNIMLLAKLAQVVTLYRPTVNFYGSEIYINFYGMLFMPSGAGKDYALSNLDKDIITPYYAEFAGLQERWKMARELEVETEADTKFKSSKAERERWINENLPRTILAQGSEGTLEGWVAQREALEQAGFGATNFYHSELGDLMGRRNDAGRAILTYLKDTYDGVNKAKVIKGNKALRGVSGVPANFFGHSPMRSILDEDSKQSLIQFLDSGMARRCMICIEEKLLEQDFSNVDSLIAETKEAEEYAREYAHEIRKVIARILNRPGWAFTLESKAEKAITLYKLLGEQRTTSLSDVTDEGIAGEIRGRYYKALKLAGLLHSIEDDSDTMKAATVTRAILQVEYYGKYTEKAYRMTAPSTAPKCYQFLLDHLGKEITRTEIIEGVGLSRGNFYRLQREILSYIQDQALIDGYRCIMNKDGRALTIRLVTEEQWRTEQE